MLGGSKAALSPSCFGLGSSNGKKYKVSLVLIAGAGRSCIFLSCPAGSRTAAELLAREAAARRIITFCGNLDEVLGGGVATGQLTEFCAALLCPELLLHAKLCTLVIPCSVWIHVNAASLRLLQLLCSCVGLQARHQYNSWCKGSKEPQNRCTSQQGLQTRVADMTAASADAPCFVQAVCQP